MQLDSHINLIQSLSGHFSQSTTVYKIKFLVIQHYHKLYLVTVQQMLTLLVACQHAIQTALNHSVTVPVFIVLMSVTAVIRL